MDDEDDEPEGQGEEGKSDGATETDGGNGFQIYDWLCLIKMVSDLTKKDWDRVWEMGVAEFFNLVLFDKAYQAEQKRLQQQYRQTRG